MTQPRNLGAFADNLNSSGQLPVIANGTSNVTVNSSGGTVTVSTAGSVRATFDTSGNLGLGVTPSAWVSTTKAIQVSNRASLFSYASTTTDVGNNVYYNGTDYKYIETAYATFYRQASGSHSWYTAASGTAGNAITFTQAMTLSAAGGLSVGTTADPGAGAIYATGNITAYYSSDIKFKENVQDIPDALGIVTAIGSKTFDWTDEYLAERGGEDEYFQPKQSFGVIAQDVQKVFPQAVRTREDGSLAVDYEKLAVLSFGAIGQLLKRVEALEAK